MFKPANYRERAVRVIKQRDDIFAEAITGWATNLLFPIPDVPNRYLTLPWRRILKSRGAIRGVLFVVGILVLWPFELLVEIMRPTGGLGERIENKDQVLQFNHGDHVCLLHRSEDALQEILAHYVIEGLTKGEQCVCVEAIRVKERLCCDLRSLGVDLEKEIARGSLLFLSEEEVYFRGGEFDPQGLVKQLSESINRSLEEGFSGFRISGEISRASGDAMIQKRVIDYETRVDQYFTGKKAIGFCHYRFDAFPEAMLDSVIDAHGLHVVESLRVGAA
jgi:hypothetical protein